MLKPTIKFKKKQPKTGATIQALQLLDELADLRDDAEEINQDLATEMKAILTPAIQAKIEAAQTRANKARAALNIEEKEKEVKQAVLDLGQTVKNDAIMACWTKPRVSWNTEVLDALAEITPAINKARSEGEASVSIRKVTV